MILPFLIRRRLSSIVLVHIILSQVALVKSTFHRGSQQQPKAIVRRRRHNFSNSKIHKKCHSFSSTSSSPPPPSSPFSVINLMRGGETLDMTIPHESPITATTSSNIPEEEHRSNIQSHDDEINTNSADESYFAGKCTEMPSTFNTDTVGHSIGDHTTLPDFHKEFTTKFERELIRVSADPVLSPEECRNMIRAAEEHFKKHNNGEWTKLPSGRFTIQGTWIKDVPGVLEQFNTLLRTKLFPMLHHLFPEVVSNPSDLCIETAYLFKYTPEGGEKTDVHLDSSLLSFTILLNEESEFEGGGTFFESLDNEGGVIPMKKGHVTFRPSGIRHRGQPITDGERYIIGGFCTIKGREGCEHTRQLLSRATRALQDGDTTRAKELLQHMIQYNPKFSDGYMSFAHCCRKHGEMERALEGYKTVLEMNPRNADAAFMVGVMLGDELGRESEAMEMYKLATRLNEYDGDAWYRQGLIHSRNNNPQLERALYLRAISVQPDHTDALCNLGVSFGEAGNFENETKLYEKTLELDPEHEDALNNYKAALYHRGVDLYRMGKLEESAHCFKRFLDKCGEEENIRNAYDEVLRLIKERDANAAAKK